MYVVVTISITFRIFQMCCVKDNLQKIEAQHVSERAAKEQISNEYDSHSSWKLLCLLTLTIQNATFVQIYKYSRLDADKLFITSSVVCVSEVMKLIFSFFLMVIFNKSHREIFMFFYTSIAVNPSDTLRMCVPAVFYVVMSNLFFTSQNHLDVITFQIINQMKIPATVLFSVLMLRTNFRKIQYLSVIVLMLGAFIVQTTEIETRPKLLPSSLVVVADPAAKYLTVSAKTFGISVGLIACLLSGFSGVYFEHILRNSEYSIWARNMQLSILSIPPALVASFSKDWDTIIEKGFFFGYTPLVWLLIVLQASGGLIVALSMKLAGNVPKAYASSASIILSGISSTIIFHYKFDPTFACGAALVVLSIPLYACSFKSNAKIKPEKMPSEETNCNLPVQV